MKRDLLTRALATFAAVALSMASAQAQLTTYEFSQRVGAYTELATDSALEAGAQPDDRVYNGIPIGFDFLFNGQRHRFISLNSNGFIAFGPTVSATGIGAAYLSNATGDGLALAGTGSNNVAAALNADLLAMPISRISLARLGQAPNRQLVLQWKDYSFFQTGQLGDSLNFQIRLHEGSNTIEYVYGRTGLRVTTGRNVQVGLRGTNANLVRARTAAAGQGWLNTLGSIVANSRVMLSRVMQPPVGLAFRFTPRPDLAVRRLRPFVLDACRPQPNQTLRLTVRNAGFIPVDTISGEVRLNGSRVDAQSFIVSPPLVAGDSIDLIFTQLLNLPAGNNDLVLVARAAQENPALSGNNDTLRQVSPNLPAIAALPYVEPFTSATTLPDGWVVQQLSGTAGWQMAGPNVAVGATTFGAPRIATRGATGALWLNSFPANARFSRSRAISPCFDLSAISGDTLILEASMMRTSNYASNVDSIRVEATTDGGITFRRIGTWSRYRAFPVATLWEPMQVNAVGLLGRPAVRFAFLGIAAGGDNLALDGLQLRTSSRPAALLPGSPVAWRAIPQPAHGLLRLEGLPPAWLGTPAQLIDAAGRLVATPALQPTLDLTGLAPGLYLLRAHGATLRLLVH